jgi:hypothetical protein
MLVCTSCKKLPNLKLGADILILSIVLCGTRAEKVITSLHYVGMKYPTPAKTQINLACYPRNNITDQKPQYTYISYIAILVLHKSYCTLISPHALLSLNYPYYTL